MLDAVRKYTQMKKMLAYLADRINPHKSMHEPKRAQVPQRIYTDGPRGRALVRAHTRSCVYAYINGRPNISRRPGTHRTFSRNPTSSRRPTGGTNGLYRGAAGRGSHIATTKQTIAAPSQSCTIYGTIYARGKAGWAVARHGHGNAKELSVKLPIGEAEAGHSLVCAVLDCNATVGRTRDVSIKLYKNDVTAKRPPRTFLDRAQPARRHRHSTSHCRAQHSTQMRASVARTMQSAGERVGLLRGCTDDENGAQVEGMDREDRV